MKRSKLIYCSVLLLLFSHQIMAQPSVLATGNWYKISVSMEAIYCITHSHLVSLGIDPSSIDPRNIALYGNKAGMLAVNNNVPHANDLSEIAIKVKGESDGIFDVGDTIFFYGQSPNETIPDYSTKKFSHRQNIYASNTCYFLTIKNSPGKRITDLASQPTFTNTTSTFTDFECHDYDSVNFLHSGKAWYGDKFNSQSPVSFNLYSGHISSTDSVFVKAELIGRTLISGAVMSVSFNGVTTTGNLAAVGSSIQDNYANTVTINVKSPAPISGGTVQCSLQSTDTSAACYVNFIEVNWTRDLFLSLPHLIFSDLKSCGPGNVTRYMISNATSSLQIWDVTDPLNVFNQQFTSTLPNAEFNANNDSAHTYVTFDGHVYSTPDLHGPIPNQDLHSLSQANLIIVTPNVFLPEATTLANFHFTHDGLNSIAVTTEQIYNEYSTGVLDPVAIRDFTRQIFQRSAAANDSLKYLLLFGSASYDYKNLLGNYPSFVPTYQTGASLNLTQSRNTDDFFGLLDSNATDFGTPVAIGIGRIPVRSHDDATVINKIMNYSSSNTLGWWRKTVSVVCDDEDQGTHLRQMDTLATRMENNSCSFDLQKIYLDAYVQIPTPTHASYPGANHDIEKSITDGRLIIDYTGHGGIEGWANERVLDKLFLQSVNNNNLPLFISATSDFNKFDDPADTSCGQIISLRNAGAGIASISDTRLGFSSSTFNINQKLHSHLFEKENNQYLRLGDIFKKAKQEYFADPYVAVVCLLGDPALRLNYPEHEVVTTAINGQPTSSFADTLTPGQAIQIDGEIHDSNGNVLSSFDGSVGILIFNPKTLHYTLANDTFFSSVQPFYAWDDTLVFDSVDVNGGSFSFSFYLPYNIDSGFGMGEISYYAHNNIIDASGCYQNFIFKNLTPKVDELPGISVLVYPNPSAGKIEIDIVGIKVDDFNFSLYSAEGKRVRNIKMTANKLIIEKGSMAAGTYFYEIVNEKHLLFKKGKIVFE